MKVLQICAAYKPAFVYGGPTMSVSMLSEQLVKSGIYTEVYATTANGKKELEALPGIPVIVDSVTVTYFKRITTDHSHFSPALLKKLWSQAKSFDVIHIHAWWNLVSVFSCLVALLRNIPVIISPRGTLSAYSFRNKNIGPKWAIHHFIGKYLLNNCFLHVTSEREKEAVSARVKPKVVFLLANFVSLPAQKEWPPTLHSSCLKLIFFSRIEQKKGLEILLNALPMVSVPYSLTIAGDGEKVYIATLKEVAIKNKVDCHIHWAGFQSDNKFSLLRAHDLLVLPSFDENFGNVVIESLSLGTPVLISCQVGLAAYVKANNLGWVCETNPASVSSFINGVGNNDFEAIEKIRQYAPQIIYEDFNPDNLIKKYTDMYRQIAKE